MSEQPPRVVLDCVVYVQALISGRGPAAACVEFAKHGLCALVICPQVMAELREVPLRPSLTRRYRHLTPEVVEVFAREVERYAASFPNPPKAFWLTRDPEDEPYVSLAAAANARYLVTWNAKHLTYLMREDTPEGRQFCATFPDLRILSPPEFLSEIRQALGTQQGPSPFWEEEVGEEGT